MQRYNVEDYLELLVGLQGQGKFQIESSDQTILQSIARQVFRGTALTDRQFDLVKEKISKYENQFTALEYVVDLSVENLRMPLRSINRDKYIKLVDHYETVDPTSVYESYKEKWKWIKIRFPFSKKTIVSIENISRKTSAGKYVHRKGSHEHFFFYDERNAFNVIKEFKEKNFNIDIELLNTYEKLEEMENNKDKYLPGIYNFKLKNLTQRAIDYMISSVGEPSRENLALFRDRQELFGLHHFDELDLDNSLSRLTVLGKKIATRKKNEVFVQKTKYSLSAVAESLLELNRFPLLVVLPENEPLTYLHTIHECFKGFIEDTETTVMFRLDNSVNSDFNEYIKYHKLNSPLDKDTKIVYINNSKIPKPMLSSEWQPNSVVLMSSVRNSKISLYTDSIDLVIHYDETPSQMLRGRIEIL